MQTQQNRNFQFQQSDFYDLPSVLLAILINHSVRVHLMGDNFSDHPEPLGGGARLACWVISG